MVSPYWLDIPSCRKARETGVVEEDELETTEGLFSYVTEEEYGQLVQQRQRDSWILSDGRWV